MRHRIATICRVQEQHARLTVAMGVVADLVEDVAGTHRTSHLFGVGINQIVLGVGLDRLHERVGHAYGDVEVGDLTFLGLAGDELLDVRMVNAQDAHVGAAAVVVRHQAVGQVGVVAVNLKIERELLARQASLGHMHKPQVRDRPGVLRKLRRGRAQLAISAHRKLTLIAQIAQ